MSRLTKEMFLFTALFIFLSLTGNVWITKPVWTSIADAKEKSVTGAVGQILVVTSASLDIPAGTGNWQSASCTAQLSSMRATGGGFSLSGTTRTGPGAVPVPAGTTQDPTGWQEYQSNITDGSEELTAIAVCVVPSSEPYKIHTASKSWPVPETAGWQGVLKVSCPQTPNPTVAISGGYLDMNAIPFLQISGSQPTGDAKNPDGWQVYVTNPIGPSTNLEVYALCAE
ncbi:MAG: hypothetical protein HOJ79_05350 [Nitrospina sp.]|nr:hypothetical protein [Nitrospina sp.]